MGDPLEQTLRCGYHLYHLGRHPCHRACLNNIIALELNFDVADPDLVSYSHDTQDLQRSNRLAIISVARPYSKSPMDTY